MIDILILTSNRPLVCQKISQTVTDTIPKRDSIREAIIETSIARYFGYRTGAWEQSKNENFGLGAFTLKHCGRVCKRSPTFPTPDQVHR